MQDVHRVVGGGGCDRRRFCCFDNKNSPPILNNLINFTILLSSWSSFSEWKMQNTLYVEADPGQWNSKVVNEFANTEVVSK